MRKPFWVTWGVFACVLTGSYFRPLATDVQLARTVWGQVCVADGGVRLLAIRGDSSASWTAATVIDRDKNIWRHMLFTGPFGRIAHQSAVVDTTGTRVDTYRVDVPLLVLLLLIPLSLLVRRAIKRWVPPPRLVWAELRAPRRDGRRLSGIVRRCMLVMSAAMALGAAVLWVGSYADWPVYWRFFGDRSALVMMDHSRMELTRALHGLGYGGPAKAPPTGNDNGGDGSKDPEWHISIELMPGRLSLRHYEADQGAGSVPPYAYLRFAGFIFTQGRVPTGTIADPFALLVQRGGVVARGTERMVSARFWALFILFGLWPLVSFLRGPVRRATRRAAGCCRHCGYDLTGNTTGVCSECGTPVGDGQDGRR